MAAGASNFAKLLELARETSSEKRRELLRQVTDAFITPRAPPRAHLEADLFDEFVTTVAHDLEEAVRVELSEKIASVDLPVNRTARRLAMDSIAVARPVLEKSKALTERDLLEVINRKTQDHMMAVTRRPDIGVKVSSALVEKGEDAVVASLLSNNDARISRETFEKVAERAETSPILQAPLVKNTSVPLDVLNSVYLQVEVELRAHIMKRFQGVSPAELEAALEIGRTRVATAYGALPNDYAAAADQIRILEGSGRLNGETLVRMIYEQRRTAFTIGLARLVGTPFDLTHRIISGNDLDALAMLCRGAGFPRPIFVTMCLVLDNKGYNVKQAEELGDLYELVPAIAAQRALKFWKIRIKSEAEQAA
jgi:uncharacterized protein (DUF2336 family)